MQNQGCQVRAGDLDPQTLRNRFGAALEAVPFDFRKPETFAPAFYGVRRMFLMRPPAIADVRRYIFPAIDAARAAGVEQIVFLSIIGVEKNRLVPHFKIEKYLAASGLSYTFLRASFFMQNLSTTHRAEIKERDEIFVPVGKGKTSFIDVRDIAAVAVKTLSETGHENQAYELTGGEALDYFEVARQFSRVLGRGIKYRNPTLFRFIRKARGQGFPLPFVLVMAGLYTSTRFGMAERVTHETQQILGRPPIELTQYIEDYRSCWE